MKAVLFTLMDIVFICTIWAILQNKKDADSVHWENAYIEQIESTNLPSLAEEEKLNDSRFTDFALKKFPELGKMWQDVRSEHNKTLQIILLHKSKQNYLLSIAEWEGCKIGPNSAPQFQAVLNRLYKKCDLLKEQHKKLLSTMQGYYAENAVREIIGDSDIQDDINELIKTTDDILRITSDKEIELETSENSISETNAEHTNSKPCTASETTPQTQEKNHLHCPEIQEKSDVHIITANQDSIKYKAQNEGIPESAISDLKTIQSKLAKLRCRDSDSRWAQKRILEILPHILEGDGVDYSAPDMKGNTCLHYACELGSRQLIHWLVENQADINCVEQGGGNTPLHNAARLASLHTVTYLLEHGANAAIRNQQGQLPADVVGRDDHDTIVKLLNERIQNQHEQLADSCTAAISNGKDFAGEWTRGSSFGELTLHIEKAKIFDNAIQFFGTLYDTKRPEASLDIAGRCDLTENADGVHVDITIYDGRYDPNLPTAEVYDAHDGQLSLTFTKDGKMTGIMSCASWGNNSQKAFKIILSPKTTTREESSKSQR